MATQRGLTVREHERQRVEMPVEFVICDEHRTQVRFTTSSSAMEQFAVDGVTMDLSAGGLGFTSKQLVPRNCEGTVRVFAPTISCPVDGRLEQAAPPHLEHRARVRRVWMNGRDGTYAIGLAFVDPTPQLERKVDELVHAMEQTRNNNEERQRA
jgi:c-di-GMP-binding flagellar brake protein YcgR